MTVHYDIEKGQGKPIPLADFLIMFSGWGVGAGGNLSRCWLGAICLIPLDLLFMARESTGQTGRRKASRAQTEGLGRLGKHCRTIWRILWIFMFSTGTGHQVQSLPQSTLSWDVTQALVCGTGFLQGADLSAINALKVWVEYESMRITLVLVFKDTLECYTCCTPFFWLCYRLTDSSSSFL